MGCVTVEIHGDLARVVIDNPPVNALAQAVRAGLLAAQSKLMGVRAVVLYCTGHSFVAGADIRELGKPPSDPILPEVLAVIEAAPDPLGGGDSRRGLGGGLCLHFGCGPCVAQRGIAIGEADTLAIAGMIQRIAQRQSGPETGAADRSGCKAKGLAQLLKPGHHPFGMHILRRARGCRGTMARQLHPDQPELLRQRGIGVSVPRTGQHAMDQQQRRPPPFGINHRRQGLHSCPGPMREAAPSLRHS